MVDPTQITNFNLTNHELEETFIWWILAAGKDGIYEAKCANSIMRAIGVSSERSPFAALRNYDVNELTALLAQYKTGAQSLKSRTIFQVINAGLNLRTCSREDLLQLWGMGMKTATCFILHSRPDQEMAGIDTHYLKFLKDMGVDVPKHRPSKPKDGSMHKEYLRLEAEGVRIAKAWGWSCCRLDLTVWNTYREGRKLLSPEDCHGRNGCSESQT